MLCFPSSALPLTGEAEARSLQKSVLQILPSTREATLLPAKRCYSVENIAHNKYINRVSYFRAWYLLSSTDHHGLYRNSEFFLHTGGHRRLSVVDNLYSVAYWVSFSLLLTLGKACLTTLHLQFTLGFQAVWSPVSISIYTDLIFLPQRVLCTTGPFKLSFYNWRSLHYYQHQSLA